MSHTKEQNGSELLPLPKNYGPEASHVKGQSISMRLPHSKNKEPEASARKQQSNSMRQPLLKRKEPEASVNKEQSSSMRLPLLKRKEAEASPPSKEQSSSMRLPLQKQKEPEASVSKEQSSSMRLPLLKRRATEASVNKEQSSSMRLPYLRHNEPEASVSKEKERSFSISMHKGSETLLREERAHSVWTPLPKKREPDASLREESCSTSGRVDLPAQHKPETSSQSIEAQPIFSTGTGAVEQKLNLRPDQQSPPLTLNDANVSKGSSSSKSRRQKTELRYKALMEEWVPQVLQMELTGSDDEGWLFQKHGDRQEKSKLHETTVNYELSYGSWPCAQYLPEADLYALPFTVPL